MYVYILRCSVSSSFIIFYYTIICWNAVNHFQSDLFQIHIDLKRKKTPSRNSLCVAVASVA